jgi:TP901 family phage tail tape measure protein
MVSNPFQDGLSVRVDSDLSGFNSGIDNAITRLNTFETKVGAVGTAIGALAAGGLAKAADSAASFEESMVEVEKVTDPGTAEEMGDAIQDMAGAIPVAQSELSNIAAVAGRLGVEGEDNIRRFTEVPAEMATATDLGTEEAADSFARMTTLMNEPMDNVRNLGDTVNGLSNNLAASSGEITEAATRSAGALTQLGLSSEQVLAVNASMNEVSASSRIAGTQLRRFAQELTDPKKVEDLASALGMSTDEFRTMRE